MAVRTGRPACCRRQACSAIHVERFGLVTIPILAFIGFITILALLLLAGRSGEEETP